MSLLFLAAALGTVAPPEAFAGVPHLRFVYQPITGGDIAVVHASLEASAFHPPGGGSSFGRTEYRIDWHWRGRVGPGGACRVTSASVTFGARVVLPRLADPATLDPDVVPLWNRFEGAIARHEAGHARMAWARVPRVRAALLGQRCDDADAAARAAVAALGRDEAAYDRDTRHGAAQGAHFP